MFFDKKQKEEGHKQDCVEYDLVMAHTGGLVGDIKVKGNARIDGELTGTVSSEAYLYIGTKALIKGDLLLKEAVIAGAVVGDIICLGSLELKATAKIYGDIICNHLTCAPQACIKGTCSNYPM
ncbi:MAG: polymer-forming cytoskeletal protein [Acidaminococcaceae bacterium]